MCKSQVGRKAKTFKCYISIFICFSTKAVLLALVSDLSSLVFLAVAKRFITHCSRPSTILSDCATDFEGASKKLKKIYQNVVLILKSSDIYNYITSEGITWLFNPSTSHHFSGL